MSINSFFKPAAYIRRFYQLLDKYRSSIEPNSIGAIHIPAGTFYSPLLDIASLGAKDQCMAYDGQEYWDAFDLNIEGQRSLYEALFSSPQRIIFPKCKSNNLRYYSDNDYFPSLDAFLLSGLIQKFSPQRIIEVGSGYSSAVMLDTLDCIPHNTSCKLTFIEPYPDRLKSLLKSNDTRLTRIIQKPVQEVSLSLFEELDDNDMLFIDSSHVAKVGSDVAFLLLRVLPRLKPGVIVHFHDIVYPYSYPIEWIKRGIAWNESLFLRAYLAENKSYEVIAFNSFATVKYVDLFKQHWVNQDTSAGSLWIRRRRDE